MPYTHIFHLKNRTFQSSGEVYWASGGHISSFDFDIPQSSIFGFYQNRDGSNSSSLDLLQLFGPSAFRHVIRSVTVGYDFKKVSKTVYYVDARGKLRSKIKSKIKKIPRKVRTVQFVKIRDAQTPVADRSRFLKPNHLSYKSLVNYQAPKVVTVNSDVPGYYSSLVRAAISAEIDGPGMFIHPTIPNLGGVGVNDGVYVLGSAKPAEPSTPSVDPLLQQEALKKLYDKVSSSLPNYFLTVAESDKTVALIKATLIEALKLAKMIYRLKLREILGSFKKHSSISSLADHWLAWWYGIMPTIYDVEDTIAFLSEKERLWRSYTASAKRNDTILSQPVLGVSNIRGTQTNSTIHTEKFGVIIEGKLGFNDYLIKASKPLDNAALIYELIPFSFVLDWIIDIGSYLQGLEVLEDKIYHAWHTTVHEEIDQTIGQFVNNVYQSNRKHSSVPFVAGFSSVSVKRTPITEFPELRFPRVSKPMVNQAWLKRTVTALALETQKLHRTFR